MAEVTVDLLSKGFAEFGSNFFTLESWKPANEACTGEPVRDGFICGIMENPINFGVKTSWVDNSVASVYSKLSSVLLTSKIASYIQAFSGEDATVALTGSTTFRRYNGVDRIGYDITIPIIRGFSESTVFSGLTSESGVLEFLKQKATVKGGTMAEALKKAAGALAGCGTQLYNIAKIFNPQKVSTNVGGVAGVCTKSVKEELKGKKISKDGMRKIIDSIWSYDGDAPIKKMVTDIRNQLNPYSKEIFNAVESTTEHVYDNKNGYDKHYIEIELDETSFFQHFGSDTWKICELNMSKKPKVEDFIKENEEYYTLTGDNNSAEQDLYKAIKLIDNNAYTLLERIQREQERKNKDYEEKKKGDYTDETEKELKEYKEKWGGYMNGEVERVFSIIIGSIQFGNGQGEILPNYFSRITDIIKENIEKETTETASGTTIEGETKKAAEENTSTWSKIKDIINSTAFTNKQFGNFDHNISPCTFIYTLGGNVISDIVIITSWSMDKDIWGENVSFTLGLTRAQIDTYNKFTDKSHFIV